MYLSHSGSLALTLPLSRHPAFSCSLCLALSLCCALSLSVALSLLLSLCRSVSLSFSVALSLSVALSRSLSLLRSLSLSVSLSFSVALSLFLCWSLCLALCLALFLCCSLSLSLCLALFLCRSLSVTLFLCLSSMMKGSTSHKAIDLSGNPILRLYYTSRPVLFVMCMGNELFFCLLYVSYYIEEPHVWLQWLLGVCAVVCVLKSAISVLHLITASRNMAAIDVSDRERERSKAE
uniref:CDP-diacylglycerol--inositol 3-phosphatidyltransferase (phosphatidylinositol synthase) n=1 Tax=Oncorhynchus tshawytscha TaxID=74940 RepID=A0AAZ3QK22_ONCTS